MMKENDRWYTIHDTGKIDTPALIVYPERVKENIRILKGMIDDTSRLRPHVKTHKTTEATLLMMQAGINKFKCATIAEAEMLGMSKAPDVLLAYPPNGPKLERFVTLIKKYPATFFSCLVDNKQSAKEISGSAVANGLTIPVYIDLNVGMNRTGIKPGKNAVELFEDCANSEGMQLQGFHAYDGHIRERDIQKRAVLCNEYFAPVKEMIAELFSKGYQQPKIVIGGSPSFPIYAKHEDVECSPGTFIFWDKGYADSLPEQNFLYAALVITRVVSMPGETKLCLDLGYKAIASENEFNHRVYFLNAPGLKIVSHSEEHMVVDAGEGHTWKVGDVLYALPVHICPTCAMYDAALTAENGELTGAWDIIARKRKIIC
ncbi:MAG TPA: D-TA family PLP-dependent enzyme [Chitinophagaceae bacterium]|nr:D-TA family PLP-dependent enzyme [Chitinophagaceae bacterium]